MLRRTHTRQATHHNNKRLLKRGSLIRHQKQVRGRLEVAHVSLRLANFTLLKYRFYKWNQFYNKSNRGREGQQFGKLNQRSLKVISYKNTRQQTCIWMTLLSLSSLFFTLAIGTWMKGCWFRRCNNEEMKWGKLRDDLMMDIIVSCVSYTGQNRSKLHAWTLLQ